MMREIVGRVCNKYMKLKGLGDLGFVKIQKLEKFARTPDTGGGLSVNFTFL